MPYALLQLIFFAFMVTWVGVTIVLFSQCRRKQGAYLRRFPPSTDI